MSTLEIHVPVAATRVETQPLAARPAHAGTMRIGWLDNRKANAGELLREAAAALRRGGLDFEAIPASKDPTAAAPEATMAHLETCDAVVLAIAD